MIKKKILFGKALYRTVLCSTYILVLLLFALSFSYAHPPLPTEFYGTVTVYNAPATGGTVTAYISGVDCGQFDIVNNGYYGVLSCKSDDPETGTIEGPEENDTVYFEYNSNPASAFGDRLFSPGSYKWVNITYPEVYCGDHFCDGLENCLSCPQDCFSCNATGNTTGNATGNATSNQTGHGGGGHGGGGGAGGGGEGGGNGVGGGGNQQPTGEIPMCVEKWVCGNWTVCSQLGLQTRVCHDDADCGTYSSKPLEVKECTAEGNCFDNNMNCHNGLCEEGIDCGGPCEKKCSIFEKPFQNVTVKIPKFEIPREICERHVDFSDPSLWIFILFIIFAYIVRMVYSQIMIERLRKNERLAPLVRARKVHSQQRKTLLFGITLFFLTIAAFSYSYYFLLCPNEFLNYSWMLLILLILIPVVIHSIWQKLEYNEVLRVEKEKMLEDSHYQHIVDLIDLENDMLADEENKLANRMYELSKDPEFDKLMQDHDQIKRIYKYLAELYARYHEHKNPYNVEKDFAEEIESLNQDAEFKKSLTMYPEMKPIFDKLLWLYGRYAEKQKLYDKLEEVENKPVEKDVGENKIVNTEHDTSKDREDSKHNESKKNI